MNIEGAELRLKQARETRAQAETEVEQAKRRRKGDLSRKLTGEQWIASRFKLEKVFDRLKQARALEARCELELREVLGQLAGGEAEER